MGGSDLGGAVLDSRYRLVERLAEGAMGVVYRGVSLKLDRAVAVKVMHASLPGEMAARERFEREAKVMALLEHPHCVSVIDCGLFDGKPYVVMELVRGSSLHDLIADHGRFEPARAGDILRQVLSGLAHAHDQGIIHRDIKPANIMVTPKAPLGVHVRILDFGLARLIEGSSSLTSGFAVGTPSYMAPEQCRGEPLDTRVDIYACGIVLFEMLTGRKPFVAKDPIDTVRMHLTQPPPRLGDVAGGVAFGALEGVVARALAKAPADRFATAIAMSQAIDAALGGRTPEESTAELDIPERGVEELGSSALVPVSSIDVPITVGSSTSEPVPAPEPASTKRPPTPSRAATVPAPPPPASPRSSPPPPSRTEPVDDRSMLQRMLPVSRMRWFVLGAIVVIGAAAYGLVRFMNEEAPKVTATVDARAVEFAIEPVEAPVDPAASVRAAADELVAQGRLDAALDAIAKGRRKFPTAASLPYAAGKIYFTRLFWGDGIAAFRDAIRLDAALRDDPELIRIALRGFITTPETSEQLAQFLVELGPATESALDETARTHPNPVVRARAAAMLQRMRTR